MIVTIIMDPLTLQHYYSVVCMWRETCDYHNYTDCCLNNILAVVCMERGSLIIICACCVNNICTVVLCACGA